MNLHSQILVLSAFAMFALGAVACGDDDSDTPGGFPSAGAAGEVGSGGSSTGGNGGSSTGGDGGSATGGNGGSATGGNGGSATGGDGGSGTGGGETGGDGGGSSSDGALCVAPDGPFCMMAQPQCPAMQVVEIVGMCWGECIPIGDCACSGPEDCPDNNQYTCIASTGRCSPYVF